MGLTVNQQVVAWSRWKILGGARPAGVQRVIPAEWWRFLAWAKWRMRGHPSPRPAVIPPTIPGRWWVWKRDLEALLAVHHDHPIPGVSALALAARNVEFCAQEPELAKDLKRHQRVAWSADQAYPLDPGLVEEVRGTVAGMFSWSDCRPRPSDPDAEPPFGTPALFAIQLAVDRRLDGWIGQAETWKELRHAAGIDTDGRLMTPGEMLAAFGHSERAQIVVGNPNDWMAAQRTQVISMCLAGQLAVIVECYTNNAHPWPDAYDSRGVPVASWCLGCYDASDENPNARGWLDPLDYQPHMAPDQWANAGSYHLAGIRPGKIATLP